MAPGYRNSTRRQNRSGLIDHDIFEGLPVRQWRRGLVTVEPSIASENTTQQNNIWAIELPHGMPKDSHLLSEHSQDLLRAARSGKIYKRHPGPVSIEEEEADSEVIVGDKVEKKDEPPQDNSFVAKAWKQVPRHLEGPDIEYLAKRRKGLIKATKTATLSTGSSLVKTIVKKVDAVGNEYVQEIYVSQAKQADGEVMTNSNSTAEGYVAHNQSPFPKRKGPFRKKIKPVGRGRKKKLLPPTSKPIDSTMGLAPNIQINHGTISECYTRSMLENSEDIEMGEESVGNSEDGEVDDGDENEEEEELIEKQSIPTSASKTMLDATAEDYLITDTGAQYTLPVEQEKLVVDSGLKNESTETFIPDSSSKLQIANAISQLTETNTKNKAVLGDVSNVKSTISWEMQQDKYEAVSLVQTIPLPVAMVDNIYKHEEILDPNTGDNCVENDSERRYSALNSDSQMNQEVPTAISKSTSDLILDSERRYSALNSDSQMNQEVPTAISKSTSDLILDSERRYSALNSDSQMNQEVPTAISKSTSDLILDPKYSQLEQTSPTVSDR
ncbi:putative lyr family protein [Erysiphe neolycopersici]|uniref:Putative lyr family protein n=1 Tax=Erysiphe neolycopersici TaxID=212602 RepID=A0A420HCG1_9PEZI|nr:putative lyr family protein [Erysiphe neolycopersici]